MSIVVAGAVFVDIKGFPFGPLKTTGRNAGHIERVHGGVSRNIAVDLAQVGLRPVFVSLVDDTPDGADVKQKLEAQGVCTNFLFTVPDGMGTWLAIFNSDGDVYAEISKRPVLSPLKDKILENRKALFRGAESLLLEVDMDEEVIHTFYTLAEQEGVPVYAAVSNIEIAKARRDYIRRSACFVCNISEASDFFGEPLTAMSIDMLPAKTVELIRHEGLPAMVITLGEKGVVFASADGECGLLPACKVDPVDSTGAGDAFFAGTCAALSKGASLRDACRVGTRLAASAISVITSTCERFTDREDFVFPDSLISSDR